MPVPEKREQEPGFEWQEPKFTLKDTLIQGAIFAIILWVVLVYGHGL